MIERDNINNEGENMSYIDLNSVGSTVTDEGLVFPIDCSEAPETASEAEEMMGVHILDMDNESNFWGHMSVEDCNELMGFLTPLFFSGDLPLWDGSFVDWGMERLQWVINNNYMIDELQNHLLAGGTI